MRTRLFQTGGRTVASTAYEASHVISATPSTLLSLNGYNSGSAQFIQVHDATALPSNTAVPILTFTVAATTNFSLDAAGPIGISFLKGIVVCNSSTGPTKTIGSADCWFTVVCT